MSDVILYGSLISLALMYSVVFLYFINQTISKKFTVGTIFIVLYFIIHFNEHALASFNGYLRSDLVSISILSIAITYTFWMNVIKQNFIIHFLSLSSFLTALSLTDTAMKKSYIGMVFILLSIWKFTNDFFIKKFQIALEKSNKLDAYKETIGLLNHEFNNVNGLALLLLKRKKKEERLTEDEQEFEKVLRRVSGLVKDLSEIEDYETEEYTKGIEITKINNQNQSQS